MLTSPSSLCRQAADKCQGGQSSFLLISFFFTTSGSLTARPIEDWFSDEVNFLAYALVVVHELEAHHAAEEAIFFPYFVSKGVQGMDHNIDDHAGVRCKPRSFSFPVPSVADASSPPPHTPPGTRGVCPSSVDARPH